MSSKPIFGTLLLVGGMLALSSCDGTTIIPNCDNLGTDGPGLKAAAVISAVEELSVEADRMATDLLSVCDSLATELGVAMPTPEADQTPREALCSAVAAEIQTIVTEAEAAINVVVEPAVCNFSVDAYASCVAECDIDVNADVEVMCTEGQLSGSCSGECSGSCTVEGSATCMGECSGSCSGQCTGNCTGACEGECSATDDEGNCVGTCDGTCMGSCSATCMGSCSGSCTAEVTGSCEGSCRGSCDVDFEAPRCDGSADVSASAECEAACDAEITAMASCTEPRVSVEFAGTASAGRVADLQRALQLHWPTFLALRARIGAGVAAADDVRAAVVDLSDATVATAACLAGTLNAALEAVASFEISVTVSVEVSASVVAE